ncbi:hypothetical protein K438DRAFT_2048576 [Mycena galopus ATCC 62051]|nr:hypothetical protein K438DRAFT_2048576 [Mycena galopus ATCC 62051]
MQLWFTNPPPSAYRRTFVAEPQQIPLKTQPPDAYCSRLVAEPQLSCSCRPHLNVWWNQTSSNPGQNPFFGVHPPRSLCVLYPIAVGPLASHSPGFNLHILNLRLLNDRASYPGSVGLGFTIIIESEELGAEASCPALRKSRLNEIKETTVTGGRKADIELTSFNFEERKAKILDYSAIRLVTRENARKRGTSCSIMRLHSAQYDPSCDVYALSMQNLGPLLEDLISALPDG